MDKKDIINYWDSGAKEALQIAQHLFDKKDYSYALFSVTLLLRNY
jgi:hypothetical protein